MYGLAKAAGVSYRTVFKAEMEARPRLRHSTLEKIARPLGLYPDQLFVRANLTPYLKPWSPDEGQATRRPKTFVVTDEEFESLTRYLKFLQLWEMTTS